MLCHGRNLKRTLQDPSSLREMWPARISFTSGTRIFAGQCRCSIAARQKNRVSKWTCIRRKTHSLAIRTRPPLRTSAFVPTALPVAPRKACKTSVRASTVSLNSVNHRSRMGSDSVVNVIYRFFSGAPVYLSFPHFYRADPKLLEAIEGLKPVEKLHETYFKIQPVSRIRRRNPIFRISDNNSHYIFFPMREQIAVFSRIRNNPQNFKCKPRFLLALLETRRACGRESSCPAKFKSGTTVQHRGGRKLSWYSVSDYVGRRGYRGAHAVHQTVDLSSNHVLQHRCALLLVRYDSSRTNGHYYGVREGVQ